MRHLGPETESQDSGRLALRVPHPGGLEDRGSDRRSAELNYDLPGVFWVPLALLDLQSEVVFG